MKLKARKKLNRVIQEELLRESFYHLGCADGQRDELDKYMYEHGVNVGLTIASVKIADILCYDKHEDIDTYRCQFEDNNANEFPCKFCMEKSCDK